MVSTLQSVGSSGRTSTSEDNNNINDEDQEMTKLALASFQAREEEIERKKMEVKGKVESQLSRAEEETRRLVRVWEELEVLTDPMRKEVAMVRKKIDVINREIKSLGQTCQKKEKEYREVLEAFNEKNNEKTQLTSTLVELVKESEKFRMGKLEELSKVVNSKR
ncbi:hypothetical protein CQW23_27849 [Capsicum baccatum]|uniref:Uncharacterized protein n=2 Tax=Capsicum TaxID=4071 RepID=A0A1U8F532_CAPAN|nr:uncharacterized protein LOC107850641 [Capsicum annuum]PHT31512.1 hypothetical protein CQW23_27849 [Capsicum baccatum]PHU00215.1 hypothetical protein BC332_30002 [Capsicum chinense]KAF3626869.1 putative pleiotropic drug resistance protein 2-like isoform X1 [Capsicum annuum]KAF3633381.1 putative pleiotropic drug resistance protein 2-like isoform X1 [Capsicum annuum]PHT65162.1 hypothetical protein T459_29587 [Capsicum annuum]